jgi:hypothetical protein
MNTFYFTDADDLVDIRQDNVFKAVFTRDNPVSKIALSKLVSANMLKPSRRDAKAHTLVVSKSRLFLRACVPM